MSEVPGSEQHPATLRWGLLRNTRLKSSVCWDGVPELEKKKKKL